VNNQEILDNAPEGATHWDGAQYYRYHKDDWFSFHRFEWIDANEDELHTACSIRLLADIKHIVELEEGMLENMALGIQASIDFYIKNTASAIQGHIDYGILGKAEASDPDSIPIEILQRDIKALRKQSKGGAE
jgi:hypothetical protein